MPTPSIPLVLILAEGVAPDALGPAEEILRKLGVEYRQTTLVGPGNLPDVAGKELLMAASVIIVASPDAAAPALLAASRAPVIRVPVESDRSANHGLSLLSAPEVAEDRGEGFATVALGHAGATNAALLAVAILAARGDERLRRAWSDFRQAQTAAVLEQTLPVA